MLPNHERKDHYKKLKQRNYEQQHDLKREISSSQPLYLVQKTCDGGSGTIIRVQLIYQWYVVGLTSDMLSVSRINLV